jgi:pimeloyl-ACP methyl ester carboxylesterase
VLYPRTALPRRCSFGLEVARDLSVVRALPGGVAARAGVRAGDRLVEVCGTPADAATLAALARGVSAGEVVPFVVDRGGERLTMSAPAAAAPIERVAGADVTLGDVSVDGAVERYRLRTLRTTPRNARAPHRNVLCIAGLGHATCELPPGDAPSDAPERRFLEALGQLGLATLRVERAGVGDSEGPAPRATGFLDEVAGYRAALDALVGQRNSTDDADPQVGDVVLFGTSLGGMIAPLLARRDAGVRAVVVFGTSARRWVDCVLHATRRQRALAGAEGAVLEAHVAAWTEIQTRICRGGETPAEIFAARPDLAVFEGPSCHGRTIYGRDVAFFQELERVDLSALWATVDVPILVLQGKYDWVCPPEEGRSVALAAGPRARYVELPGVGHDMRRHASLAESFRQPRAGAWDGSVTAAIARWLDEVVAPSQGSTAISHEAWSNA